MNKQWGSISENAKNTMSNLGSFGPTTKSNEKLIKGYMVDEDGERGKIYFDSDDLRRMAAGMIEVAEWLENRAKDEV